jgi:hypothetical protein|tara:strand:+ start:682 stop:792 length:111 start_codon:yes stop_codon:yes gene_type:complete
MQLDDIEAGLDYSSVGAVLNELVIPDTLKGFDRWAD